ncbi:MAG: NifB/NifX family molybdenum-iron cluster-binding protein [Clostridiaceae bacterium]|nr:NifB/NifX family molybdenum-iron cluster-binding protein [Clostridiaceae bacterium]
MRIAVPYENGRIFPHFGHTEQFKVYDTADGRITDTAILPAAGSGHGALAALLQAQGVTALICGGIGGGARSALAEAGIALYPGAAGDADGAVAALLAGTLCYDPDTVCAHPHTHGEGHNCSHAHGAGHDCRHGRCK